MLTLIPRIVIAAVRTLLMMPLFGVASFFYLSDLSDPKTITNNKTPVLLIHGSGANQRQWEVFRHFLKGEECGHIFSVTLNDNVFTNDKKGISEFAQQRVAKKIDLIKDRYLQAGYKLDDVILVGHSMGGMIAGEYAVNHATDVKVKNIIALNTPWHGSRVADMLYDVDAKPEGAFVTTNPTSKALREQVIQAERAGELNVFTFSSSLDPLVRPWSSSLPIRPDRQIYSQAHDHYSAMVDPWLALDIRDRWIAPNTRVLASA